MGAVEKGLGRRSNANKTARMERFYDRLTNLWKVLVSPLAFLSW